MAARRARLAAALPLPPSPLLTRRRLRLVDGRQTTLHVAEYDAREVAVELALLQPPVALEQWCRATGTDEALVGGFFVRSHGRPLGELRLGGAIQPSVPFVAPWDGVRACVLVAAGRVRLARRDALPRGRISELLQAGPLLLRGGVPMLGNDAEGFSAGAAQFDSDITVGRYPRAALGLAADRILAVAADGRGPRDAGLTLHELLEAMVELGARDAINLDGGGSTSLVSGGRLRNRPREGDGAPIPGGRPVSTALVFRPRA